MQAVIRTGGKQYYVTAGDILEVEKLTGDIGEIITLDDVLMVANDDDVTVGQPTVQDAAVTAKITGQYRGNKILVFRYRPKKRIRVRRGHRQYLTRLEIQSIKLGDLEFVVPEPIAPPPAPIIEEADVQVEEVEVEEAIADATVVEETATEETVAEATADVVETADTSAVAASTVDEETSDEETDAEQADVDDESDKKE